MTTTEQKNYEENDATQRLVFYIEVLRQNSGTRAMTQDDVAAVSGVPRARIGRLERTRQMPQVLKDLIAVGYALGVSNIEALIAPDVRELILEEVDEHRETRGLPPLRPHPPAGLGFRPSDPR